MIKAVLVPEQQEAVERLMEKPRFVIADSVGFGKTLTVLAAYDRLRQQAPDCRMLVFANKNAVGNWAEQVREHTDFSIVTGGSDNVEKASRRILTEDPDVVVLTYPSISARKGQPGKYWDLLIQLYEKRPKGIVLILEEAHYVRNPDSKRHDIVNKVMQCSPAVWALTATPINNEIEDIYNMMNLVIPGFFGTLEYFMGQYTVREWKDQWNPFVRDYVKTPIITGYVNLDELFEKIQPYMARRTREVSVKFEAVTSVQSSDEEDMYLVAAAGMIGVDEEDEEAAVRDFGARMPDLQRVVDGAVDVARELRTDPELTAKERALVDGLRESFRIPGKAAVVFCFYNLTFQRLRMVLEDHREYVGFSGLRTLSRENGTPEERHAIASGFDHGEVLLMTSVGKEAMNLRKVDEMWMYNIPDSVGDVVQAAGRMTRRDSEYKEFVVKVPVVRDTIDEYKVAKLLSRAAVIERTVGGDEVLPEGRMLSHEDLRDMRRELLWRVSKR